MKRGTFLLFRTSIKDSKRNITCDRRHCPAFNGFGLSCIFMIL